jgi:hypothetical protein
VERNQSREGAVFESGICGSLKFLGSLTFLPGWNLRLAGIFG